MPFINLGDRGFTGPSTFDAAGAEQTLTLPYSITISGGVILGSETNLSVEDPSVYGTAYFGLNLPNTITISFPSPVTSFAIEVFNGEPYTDTYTVSDNVGDSTSVTLPPNTSDDASTVILPLASSASTLTITTSDSSWDFSIDNIAFDFQPADIQIPKTHSISDNVVFGLSNATAYYSVYAALAAPETAGLSLLGDVAEFVGTALNAYTGFAFIDPFDSNYATEVVPTFYALPTIQSDAVITTAFADDANTAFSDASTAISYMQSMYISLNRYNSAVQVGDQASANLQNVAVDTYLGLASSSLQSFASDLTVLAGDLPSLNTSTDVTNSEITAFLGSISSDGFSALPQEEQDLFATFGFSTDEEQSIISSLGSIDPSDVPLSFASALEMEITAITNLANIYGAVDAACFASGTRILTPRGELPVENLRDGDVVITNSGHKPTIKWIGKRCLDLSRHPHPENVQPIRFEADCFADDVPTRDLFLSPDHALYIDGILVPAKTLINGKNICQIAVPSMTYYHIELDEHSVIFAENTPAETYLETGNRGAFQNCTDAVTLHPDFAQTEREAKGCAPFMESGPQVEVIRKRILERANIETTDDPALTVEYRNGNAIIQSRHAIPGMITPDPRDRRRLGVKVASIIIDGRHISFEHPALVEGWHDAEPDGRWTNGNAVIPAELLAGGRDVSVILTATLPYPVAA